MTDTAQHYLCNNPPPVMPVDGDCNQPVVDEQTDQTPEQVESFGIEIANRLQGFVDKLERGEEITGTRVSIADGVVTREQGVVVFPAADRTCERDRIAELTRERDETRTQLEQVARERDEIAKRFLGVEPADGGKWGIFCDGVKPVHDTIIEACVAADEINREQLARTQLSESKNLQRAISAEQELAKAREQLEAAKAEAAAWRECVMEPMRDWDSVFSQLEHVACERKEKLKGREWASDHVDRINRTRNAYPASELLERHAHEIGMLINCLRKIQRCNCLRDSGNVGLAVIVDAILEKHPTKTPSPEWFAKMAKAEDECQSVTAISPELLAMVECEHDTSGNPCPCNPIVEDHSSDDPPPAKCDSCGVAYTDHLGLQGTCKRLQESQAEAAAMREALDKCRIELVWIMRQTKSRKGGSVDKAHAAAFAALGSTAGRELLDEMKRKDKRIAELECRINELGSKTWEDNARFGRLFRKCEVAKRDLVEARQKLATLEERIAGQPVVTLRVPTSERTKELKSLRSRLSAAEAKAAKLDELQAMLAGREMWRRNAVVTEIEDGGSVCDLLISIRDGGAACSTT